MKKRKNIVGRRNIAKERALRPYLGFNHTSAVFSQDSGSTYTYQPPALLRLNPDNHIALYRQYEKSVPSPIYAVYADFTGKEEINYVNGNRYGMNNCVHRMIRTTNVPFGIMFNVKGRFSLAGYSDYYRLSQGEGIALYLGQHMTENLVNYRPGGDPLFSARAFWSMRPKFAGEVSIINSIFELKDFKDILHLSRIANRFKRIASSRQWSSYKREFQKLAANRNIAITLSENHGVKPYATDGWDTLSSLARDVSGAAAASVLTMNLAIKPTIADVLAIAAQSAVSARNAQEQFRVSGDDGSLSHFSENEVILNTLKPVVSNNTYWQASGRFYTIKKTATMRSFYEYKARSMTDTLVRYWGLAGTMEALWNMLPLSFVLDYVLTIGKTLSFMERDDNVTNLCTDYCETTKIELSSGAHVIQSPDILALIIDGKTIKKSAYKPHLVSGTECLRYERRVMEPYKGPAFPKIRKPSSSQAVNVLALARCFLF